MGYFKSVLADSDHSKAILTIFNMNEHELRIEKKYCANKHHTGSITNIFFQSSSLDQIDQEISRLKESTKIILIIVE